MSRLNQLLRHLIRTRPGGTLTRRKVLVEVKYVHYKSIDPVALRSVQCRLRRINKVDCLGSKAGRHIYSGIKRYRGGLTRNLPCLGELKHFA